MADISHLIHEAAREAVEEALRREARSVTGASRTVGAGGKARRIRRSTADLHETADNLVAYVENNPGQPIGQIAEALNCTSKELRLPVLKLVEEGRVDLDAPVSRFVPEYPVQDGAEITIRHLLTHTSGIPHPSLRPPSLYATHYEDVIDAIEVYRDTPLLFPPGTSFRYSSSNYNLLAAVTHKL